MKFIKYITLCLVTFIGLTSCEENSEEPQNLGSFLVSVEAINPEQKASITKATSNSADVQLFPVSIQGEKGSAVEKVLKEYPSVSKLPTEPIQLPVGPYTVSAHTPGQLEKQMTKPYFKGEQKLEIAKDVITTATVMCKMQNTKFQLVYLDQFKEKFESWTITIDDGTGSIDVYDQTDLTPEPIYYYLGENGTESLTVNVKAKTKTGNTIADARKLSKKDANESYGEDNPNFVGGDGLILKMDVTEITVGQLQINVDLNISFTDHQDDVDVDVNDKEPILPDVPVDPNGGDNNGGDNGGGEVTPTDAPSLILKDKYEFSKSNGVTNPDELNAVFKTPKGLASAKVNIITTDPDFKEVLQAVEFDQPGALLTGAELIGNVAMGDLLSGMGKTTPELGSTEYTFPLGAFLSFLEDTQGEHTFHLVLKDQAGQKVEGQITITVKP